MARNVFSYLAMILCSSAAGAHEMTPLEPDKWDRAKATHLLRRAAFGGTPAEVERLYQQGLHGAVDSLLEFRTVEYAPPGPLVPQELRESLDRRMLRMMDDDERREMAQQRRRAERRAMIETRLWWLDRLAHSPRPLEEKLALFWHGHFTSGFREVDRAWFLYEQNELLRRYGLASFRELVLGVTKDRAMLSYLDNHRNLADSPNENYARELLELFTLGVGAYTERDIRAAARALTGWTFDDSGFVFRPAAHDYGVKQFLRRNGRFDGADVVDIVLEQPACSRHLARRLLNAFVTHEPSSAFVERYAAVIRQQRFNLRACLRALFLSEGFYAPEHVGSLVKSPVELVVGTARQLGIRIVDLSGTARTMAEMGQELFQPPNVKGWPGGRKWINTATLFQRYNALRPLIYGTGGGSRASVPRNDEEQFDSPSSAPAAPNMLSRILVKDQPAYDPLPAVREAGLRSPDQIVAHFTSHLLALPLSTGEKDMLVAYLHADGKFDLKKPDTAQRIRAVVYLILCTPEYQAM